MIKLIGRLLGAGITLLFIAASAIIALNNPDLVSLSLLPWDAAVSLPLWLVILAAFGIGLLMGGAAMLPSLMRYRLTIRSLRKSLSKQEKTNLSLNNDASGDEKPSLPAK